MAVGDDDRNADEFRVGSEYRFDLRGQRKGQQQDERQAGND